MYILNDVLTHLNTLCLLLVTLGVSSEKIERKLSLSETGMSADNFLSENFETDEAAERLKESSQHGKFSMKTDKVVLDIKNRKDWVDPNNMFTYDPSTKRNVFDSQQNLQAFEKSRCNCNDLIEKLKTCEELKSNNSTKKDVCSRIEFTFLVRILKKIITRIEFFSDISSYETKLQLKFNNEDIKSIILFIEAPCNHIQDVEVTLSRVISEAEDTHINNNYYELFHDANTIYILCAFSFLLFGLWAIFFFVRASLAHPIKTSVFFIVIVSVLWHWMRLYKIALAKKSSTIEQSDFSDCLKSEQRGYVSSLLTWVGRIWYTSEDKCYKYHEATLVDPFWEVSPIVAVTETISSFVLHPLGVLGDKLGVFFEQFINHLPLTFSWPLLMGLFLVIILIIVMKFGYSIQLPFHLGSFGPSFGFSQNSIGSDTSNILKVRRIQEIETQAIKNLKEREEHVCKLQCCGHHGYLKEVTGHVSGDSWRNDELRQYGSGEPSYHIEDFNIKSDIKETMEYCHRCAAANINTAKEKADCEVDEVPVNLDREKTDCEVDEVPANLDKEKADCEVDEVPG